MLRQFQPGEHAYLRFVTKLPELNGAEVVVQSGFGNHSFYNSLTGKDDTVIGYMVHLVDKPYADMDIFVPFYKLTRKTKPLTQKDRNAVTNWDDCAWKPKELHSTVNLDKAKEDGNLVN